MCLGNADGSLGKSAKAGKAMLEHMVKIVKSTAEMIAPGKVKYNQNLIIHGKEENWRE